MITEKLSPKPKSECPYLQTSPYEKTELTIGAGIGPHPPLIHS